MDLTSFNLVGINCWLSVIALLLVPTKLYAKLQAEITPQLAVYCSCIILAVDHNLLACMNHTFQTSLPASYSVCCLLFLLHSHTL